MSAALLLSNEHVGLGSIAVVNMNKLDNAYGPVIWTKVSQAIGPGAKPRYGQGIRQPTIHLLGIQVE